MSSARMHVHACISPAQWNLLGEVSLRRWMSFDNTEDALAHLAPRLMCAYLRTSTRGTSGRFSRKTAAENCATVCFALPLFQEHHLQTRRHQFALLGN